MNAREITKRLGGVWCGGYGLAKCPAHRDRKPSLSIRDGERELIINCFAGCRWQDVKAELVKRGLIEGFKSANLPIRREVEISTSSPIIPERRELDPDQAERTAYALKIWGASVPLDDTLGFKYFTERRGLHIGSLDDLSHALRWHEGIGAVLALMTDPLTNERTGIHRTFLNLDGTKRERKMLGKSGVVRISPEVTGGLGISEGIEDALRILLSGWSPVWAAASAGAIERFPILPGVESLTIFADADEAGSRAAQVCADRWRETELEVCIIQPKDTAYAAA